MFKKMSLTILSLVITIGLATQSLAGSKGEKDHHFAEKVKAEIARLGTGPDARVEVKLRDGSKIKGYVSEVGEDHFAVTDPKTGSVTPIPYPQVKKAKGNNLSTGAKIAIGVAIAVAVILVLGFAFPGR